LSLHLALLVVIGTLSTILGLLVFFNDKKKNTNKIFALLTFSIVTWIITNYLCDSPSGANYALFWNKITMAAGTLIGLSLFYFSLSFPREFQKFPKFWRYSFLSITGIFIILTLFTGLIVKKIEFLDWGTNIIQGVGFLPFTIWSSILIIVSAIILILQYKGSQGIEKIQMKYLFLGLILFLFFGFIMGVVFAVITGNNELARYAPYSMIFFVGFSTYAILKHHLLAIRIIATEALVFLLSLIFFIETLLSKTLFEGILRGILLILVIYGGYALVQSVIKEIEHRKELQKLTKELENANEHLKELDQMKTEFISIASHELLTPISAILGYLSMILDEKLVPVDNPKTKKFLDNIYSSAKRLSKLVEDLLNVSRIEQGRIVVDRQAIDIAKAAKEVIAETMPKAKERKLTLEFEEPKETIPKVYADFDKVKEILVNIVGNAVKFTKKGGVTISLTTSRDEEIQGKRGPGNYVVISVKDTGVGIPKEEQKNIFKKFSRAGRWATRDVQGTGLGLYVSKSLTELMGGKIWVRSAAGKGSTFSFSLSEVRPDDRREISGDVAKLGEPEQKQAVDKGEVKHTKLKPESQPDDTSRRMREVLKDLTEEEKQKIRDIQIDKR
jgi:signal transduction histidine kinase